MLSRTHTHALLPCATRRRAARSAKPRPRCWLPPSAAACRWAGLPFTCDGALFFRCLHAWLLVACIGGGTQVRESPSQLWSCHASMWHGKLVRPCHKQVGHQSRMFQACHAMLTHAMPASAAHADAAWCHAMPWLWHAWRAAACVEKSMRCAVMPHRHATPCHAMPWLWHAWRAAACVEKSMHCAVMPHQTTPCHAMPRTSQGAAQACMNLLANLWPPRPNR